MSRRPRKKLNRGRAYREPRRTFHIFCEGKNTEPGYFRAVERCFSDALIELNLFAGVGEPLALSNKAKEHSIELGLAKRTKKKLNSFEEKDTVWVVFDRDNHPHYERAIDACRGAGIQVARSNPCFELWLVLHYADYEKPDGRHAVQSKLSELDTIYAREEGKNADFDGMMSKLIDAEKRACLQLSRRGKEGSKMNPPSTTVFKLTSAIRVAAYQFRRK